MLYYVLALYTIARYIKSYEINSPTLILLEEPEARAFPYSFPLLTKAIREAIDAGAYVVLTTHNGLLLSNILDNFNEEELAVYYLYIDKKDSYSHAVRLDIAKLARKRLLLEDLLYMRPSEVLQLLSNDEEHKTM
jgi:predicted ATPase